MEKFLQIKKIFKEHQNTENAVSMSNYMRNKFQFYGISAAERKALYKEFIKGEKKVKKNRLELPRSLL